MSKQYNYKKIIISLLICFQLTAVLFAPNMSSYIGIVIRPIYSSYINMLNLTSTWAFFAPEPISPPTFIDYVVKIKDSEEMRGRFPDEVDPFFFRARQNRRITLAKFMLSTVTRTQNMFMNHLCNKYKNAVSAKIWKVVGTQPDLKLVKIGKNKMTDTISYETTFVGDFVCLEKDNDK